MSEQIAKFRFKGFSIQKSLIEIKGDLNPNNKIDVEFKQTSSVNESESKYMHVLGVSIKDKEGKLNIEVEANGFFEFDKELDEDARSKFFNVNAPAILFPYVRAYITTLTSLSGISPVILPTLNLSKREKS